MVEGRSKKAFQQWLADRPKSGVTAWKSLPWTDFPDSRPPPPKNCPTRSTVMDPFHVVRLAGNALDECRRRVQLATCGHRGRKSRPALPSAANLADRGRSAHRQTEEPGWRPCSPSTPMPRSKPPGRCISARWPPTDTPTARQARTMMAALITTLSAGVPKAAAGADHPRTDTEEARRRRPGLLRPARHLQRAHRSDQRPPRTPPRIRPRIPQPHQLHRPITTGNRRIQTPTTPQIMKSRIRATLNPNAVRIAPACADRKTAEFMVKPPCSSYLSRPGGALARCELYAKCLRHRSPDTPEFAPKFKRKKRFQCP